MARLAPAAVALLLSGCGYVGEPLPPLLNIPARVTDLRAVEHGDKISVEFTAPRLNTEGTALKTLERLELRAGPGPHEFTLEGWAAAARAWDVPVTGEPVRFEIAVPREWHGTDILFGVRAFARNGRDGGWSNLAPISVVPPLAPPVDLNAQAVPQGVQLKWNSPAPAFRIFRRTPDQSQAVEAGNAQKPEWLDTTTEYGKTYFYSVQAIQPGGASVAESEISAPAEVVPRDVFPPSVPSGLRAIAGAETIELAWDPDAETDLAGYRIYRAEGDGPFKMIAGSGGPSFSDSKVQAGKRYRYAVSALDQTGNESSRSSTVEASLPKK